MYFVKQMWSDCRGPDFRREGATSFPQSVSLSKIAHLFYGIGSQTFWHWTPGCSYPFEMYSYTLYQVGYRKVAHLQYCTVIGDRLLFHGPLGYKAAVSLREFRGSPGWFPYLSWEPRLTVWEPVSYGTTGNNFCKERQQFQLGKHHRWWGVDMCKAYSATVPNLPSQLLLDRNENSGTVCHTFHWKVKKIGVLKEHHVRQWLGQKYVRFGRIPNCLILFCYLPGYPTFPGHVSMY